MRVLDLVPAAFAAVAKPCRAVPLVDVVCRLSLNREPSRKRISRLAKIKLHIRKMGPGAASSRKKAVRSQWVFGQAIAGCVAQGFSQVRGIHYNEVFAPTARIYGHCVNTLGPADTTGVLAAALRN